MCLVCSSSQTSEDQKESHYAEWCLWSRRSHYIGLLFYNEILSTFHVHLKQVWKRNIFLKAILNSLTTIYTCNEFGKCSDPVINVFIFLLCETNKGVWILSECTVGGFQTLLILNELLNPVSTLTAEKLKQDIQYIRNMWLYILDTVPLST